MRSDFVWLDLPQQQNYRTIGDATLEVFQHVVASYDFSFVLKVGAASKLLIEAVPLVLQEHLARRSATTVPSTDTLIPCHPTPAEAASHCVTGCRRTTTVS